MTTIQGVARVIALAAMVVGMAGTPADAARLSNISTRMQVLNGTEGMIAGFVINGNGAKTVVITAKGPSLSAFGINNPLPDPMLTLVRMSDQATIAINDNWEQAPNAVQILASGFVPSNALESAIMMSLAPGAYTAIVSGASGTTGTGIVEVYEVDHPDMPLANISTRGKVSVDADVMIGGFMIQGNAPQKVVVTAKGPSLAQYGIQNVLNNPQLTLVRAADQSVVATNDNWQSASNATEIAASGFAPSSSQESAILVSLEPGPYTAIMSGVGNTTGVGIVEVYVYNPVANLANPNSSAIHYGSVGQTYTYNLPMPGKFDQAFLQQGDHPMTPTELTVEWAISRVPGDFDYYKSEAALAPNGQRVCGGTNGAATGAYYWSFHGSNYQCKVDTFSQWYINVRYINNCPVGVQCPVSYYHSES